MESSDLEQIALAPMRERSEIRAPGEDWTGVTSTVERRKLQNRLNQRAARRRKRLTTQSEWPLINQASEIVTIAKVDSFVTPDLVQTIRRFADGTFVRTLRHAPRLEHLPSVMHVNALNAFAGNANAIGVANLWLFCEALSPICQSGPLLGPASAGLASCPASLRPTRLQLEVAHHPWIDLLPAPRLRDNVIRGCVLTERFDEDELWFDVVEMKSVYCGGPGGGESRDSGCASLLMWGRNPWDVDGWEATGAFLKKWGFLLEGCEGILRSTNYWRVKRGEKRINMQELA